MKKSSGSSNLRSSFIVAAFGRLHIIAFSGALILLVGCQASVPRPKGAISRLPQGSKGVTLEVAETVDDQANQLVESTKTNFFISLDDNGPAWDRTRVFFEKYLYEGGARAPIVTKIVGTVWALSNGVDAPGLYVYEVRRELVRDGYRYSVQCHPKAGGSEQSAVSNARNLARFIQAGQLEMSLLQK